jgi:ferrous iron transport protein A
VEETLKELNPGESGKVLSIGEKGPMRRRIMDMGVTPGAEIKVIKVAPLGDPIEINIRGYELSLRKAEAAQIVIERIR